MNNNIIPKMPWWVRAAHHLPPELAHDATIAALRLLPKSQHVATQPILTQKVAGIDFANPVGLAAGFDKNAAIGDKLFRFGYGFVELGTVTPLPQSGNPKPRLFRLAEDRALINSLGFNNQGIEIYRRNFIAAKRRAPKGGVIGANIGMNRDTADPLADIRLGLAAVYPMADYITINISSPNTPGLRAWQEGTALVDLLRAAKTMQAELSAHHGYRPLFCKLAPDLAHDQVEFLCQTAMAQGLDGIVATNTTIERPKQLESEYKGQQGGLSGRPLLPQANRILRQCYRFCGGKIPLIGVGGVGNAHDAYRKIKAGASLIQFYTAMIYYGPQLAQSIADGLADLLRQDGYNTIAQAIGVESSASFDHNHL
jgi:dihydroorotate dehydrogenase